MKGRLESRPGIKAVIYRDRFACPLKHLHAVLKCINIFTSDALARSSRLYVHLENGQTRTSYTFILTRGCCCCSSNGGPSIVAHACSSSSSSSIFLWIFLAAPRYIYRYTVRAPSPSAFALYIKTSLLAYKQK